MVYSFFKKVGPNAVADTIFGKELLIFFSCVDLGETTMFSMPCKERTGWSDLVSKEKVSAMSATLPAPALSRITQSENTGEFDGHSFHCHTPPI